MKKIKVCHIITMLELGGAQRNTLHTVRSLERDRFSVVLIAGRGGILDEEAQSCPASVRVHLIPSLIRRICPLKDAAALCRLLLILRREKPDVVHTHSSKAGILGRIAARMAGVPVIVHTVHGFGFHDFQSAPVRRLYVMLERLTASFTSRLVAVTTEDVKKGIDNGIGGPDDYTVIRSGIDTAGFKRRPDPRAVEAVRREFGVGSAGKLVTTIGPFKPQKNLGDFIRVARDVRRSCPEARFLIVGDGPLRPDLELLAAGARIEDALSMPGWRSDIYHILAATDVFVMTSLWEGLPRAVLEAMCAGRPVVANAVDGVREIVRNGDTGMLVEPRDTGRMAAHIVRFLRDPGLAARMGDAGREVVGKEFDIDHMVRQQEELYASLLRPDA